MIEVMTHFCFYTILQNQLQHRGLFSTGAMNAVASTIFKTRLFITSNFLISYYCQAGVSKKSINTQHTQYQNPKQAPAIYQIIAQCFFLIPDNNQETWAPMELTRFWKKLTTKIFIFFLGSKNENNHHSDSVFIHQFCTDF